MFQIDAMSRTPIYEQLIAQAEKLIMSDILSPGDQMPSVRSLSVNLSVNPMTILKAYGDLDSRGVIKSVPGRGYFVCGEAKSILSSGKVSLLAEIEKLASELALAGVPISDVTSAVNDAYSKGGKL